MALGGKKNFICREIFIASRTELRYKCNIGETASDERKTFFYDRFN